VLEDRWVSEVKTADNEMRLRVFRQQYEKAQSSELPLAIEIVRRAHFFLLVPTVEQLQTTAHPARVVLVNLKTREVLARLRRTAEGQFFMAGERAMTDPETRAAMQRQVNNCALAQAVWGELKKP
jgi:hypothetical protein